MENKLNSKEVMALVRDINEVNTVMEIAVFHLMKIMKNSTIMDILEGHEAEHEDDLYRLAEIYIKHHSAYKGFFDIKMCECDFQGFKTFTSILETYINKIKITENK